MLVAEVPGVVRKPEWLKIRPPTKTFSSVKSILKKHNLVTVCEEAHCPNMSECWSGGTATFMVLGDTCTRGCRFCNIKTAKHGEPLDAQEPEKLVAAVKELKLFEYVVITSVDRDDLPDQGSGHFARCIKLLREQIPGIMVEVLIPDFQGRRDLLKKIVDAKPDVIAHNVETVRRLQQRVRDRRAGYEQSLKVLEMVREMDKDIITKSALMLGLGETQEEVVQCMKDLREIDTGILTLGQYLQPTKRHIKLIEYVTPEQFSWYEKKGEWLGFDFVAAGPFVRSSYRAGELFVKHKKNGQKNNSVVQS